MINWKGRIFSARTVFLNQKKKKKNEKKNSPVSIGQGKALPLYGTVH